MGSPEQLPESTRCTKREREAEPCCDEAAVSAKVPRLRVLDGAQAEVETSPTSPPSPAANPSSSAWADELLARCSPSPARSEPCSGTEELLPAPIFNARAVSGRRPYQEDAHACATHLASTQAAGPIHFFGLYDGHGGSKVSSYCAQHLHQRVAADLAAGSDVNQALKQSFSAVNKEVNSKSDMREGGSTALVALVSDKHIWTAHAGDSRAVLARKDAAVPLTEDHKPENPSETERIRQAGGFVYWNGCCRVMGVLSMSRAIGDHYLQKYGVIPTPEVTCIERTPTDELLILASDGLWNNISSQEAVDIARVCMQRTLARGANRHTATRVATKVLIQAAMARGSNDNITVVVVDLMEPAVLSPEIRRCVSMPCELPSAVPNFDISNGPQLAACGRAVPRPPGHTSGAHMLKQAMANSRRMHHGDRTKSSHLLSAEHLMITI